VAEVKSGHGATSSEAAWPAEGVSDGEDRRVYMPWMPARTHACVAIASSKLGELSAVIEKCGGRRTSSTRGTVRASPRDPHCAGRPRRSFLNFIAGWAYPDFSVSPIYQLDRSVPKLMLGSACRLPRLGRALAPAGTRRWAVGPAALRRAVREITRTTRCDEDF